MICANPRCKNRFTPKYRGQSVCSALCKAEKQRIDREARKKRKKEYKPVNKAISLITDRRKAQIRIYGKIKAIWLPQHRECACREVLGCCKPGAHIQVHHMGGRQNWMLLYEPLWLPICDTAHKRITVDSDWAIQQGFSVKRSNLPRVDISHIRPICDKYGVELKLTA